MSPRIAIPLAMTVVVATGYASHYSEGVMEDVVNNRLQHGQIPMILPPVDGFIAVRDCTLIGDVWYLRPEGTEHWEMFLIVDCADPTQSPNGIPDDQWMEKYNILVEVDYPTAKRWGTVGQWCKVEMTEKIMHQMPIELVQYQHHDVQKGMTQ